MMIVLILTIFILSFVFIAFEHQIKISKTATALVAGVLIWTVFILHIPEKEWVIERLSEQMGEVSGILFFLLGAMTIVEVIDAHNGFQILTDKIRVSSKKKLFWMVLFITFFLSAILDNLTTTIIMVSLCRKLIAEKTQRLYFCGMVVLAANSGGAWSPLGDVTTTMLWIGGQISTFNIMRELIIPSLISIIVPAAIIQFKIKTTEDQNEPVSSIIGSNHRDQSLILILGLLILGMVPFFKTATHLPPYMSILLGLGLIWSITEILHAKKDDHQRHALSVGRALQKIDTPSILFFLGLLLSVGGLQQAGILASIATWSNEHIPNITLLAGFIGVLSAFIDNVPIVAAVQKMYPLTQYYQDHYFWNLVTYASGIGGSMLIIGSAAGVAAMGLEKISFFWYLKNISWLALVGYLCGWIYYALIQTIC
jgi:Na+/H+ antiporter NhaD/arsenite permease-like protein